MTNEEKARQLAEISKNFYDELSRKTALEMAEWKDEQFKESVNKAMKYLETNLQLTEAESTHIRKLFNF